MASNSLESHEHGDNSNTRHKDGTMEIMSMMCANAEKIVQVFAVEMRGLTERLADTVKTSNEKVTQMAESVLTLACEVSRNKNHDEKSYKRRTGRHCSRSRIRGPCPSDSKCRRVTTKDERECLSEALLRCLPDLVEYVPFKKTDLPDSLVGDCLTETECEDLLNQPDRKTQLKLLLEIVRDRDLKVLKAFLKHLERHNEEIVRIVFSEYEKIKQKGVNSKCIYCKIVERVDIKIVIDFFRRDHVIEGAFYRTLTMDQHPRGEQKQLWDQLASVCTRHHSRKVAIGSLIRALRKNDMYTYLATELTEEFNERQEDDCFGENVLQCTCYEQRKSSDPSIHPRHGSGDGISSEVTTRGLEKAPGSSTHGQAVSSERRINEKRHIVGAWSSSSDERCKSKDKTPMDISYAGRCLPLQDHPNRRNSRSSQSPPPSLPPLGRQRPRPESNVRKNEGNRYEHSEDDQKNCRNDVQTGSANKTNEYLEEDIMPSCFFFVNESSDEMANDLLSRTQERDRSPLPKTSRCVIDQMPVVSESRSVKTDNEPLQPCITQTVCRSVSKEPTPSKTLKLVKPENGLESTLSEDLSEDEERFLDRSYQNESSSIKYDKHVNILEGRTGGTETSTNEAAYTKRNPVRQIDSLERYAFDKRGSENSFVTRKAETRSDAETHGRFGHQREKKMLPKQPVLAPDEETYLKRIDTSMTDTSWHPFRTNNDYGYSHFPVGNWRLGTRTSYDPVEHSSSRTQLPGSRGENGDVSNDTIYPDTLASVQNYYIDSDQQTSIIPCEHIYQILQKPKQKSSSSRYKKFLNLFSKGKRAQKTSKEKTKSPFKGKFLSCVGGRRHKQKEFIREQNVQHSPSDDIETTYDSEYETIRDFNENTAKESEKGDIPYEALPPRPVVLPSHCQLNGYPIHHVFPIPQTEAIPSIAGSAYLPAFPQTSFYPSVYMQHQESSYLASEYGDFNFCSGSFHIDVSPVARRTRHVTMSDTFTDYSEMPLFDVNGHGRHARICSQL